MMPIFFRREDSEDVRILFRFVAWSWVLDAPLGAYKAILSTKDRVFTLPRIGQR